MDRWAHAERRQGAQDPAADCAATGEGFEGEVVKLDSLYQYKAACEFSNLTGRFTFVYFQLKFQQRCRSSLNPCPTKAQSTNLISGVYDIVRSCDNQILPKSNQFFGTMVES